MREIMFDEATKHLFQFMWDGYIVGGRTEGKVSGAELRLRRALMRKMQAVSVELPDTPENKVFGVLSRTLKSECPSLVLTQEEHTLLLKCFENVPWLPAKSDVAADAFDLIDGAARR